MRVLASAALAALAASLNNGLGRVPQMGYNSVRARVSPFAAEFCARSLAALAQRPSCTPLPAQWYDVEMSPSEAHVRATVDAMVSQGLVAAGYTYLNLDDGIVELARDANGDLVPDKTGFPNGFAPVAAYVKANGMQFGVYTDRGTETCGGRAGALGHEAADAAFYARNGITYLKEDSCYGTQDHQTAFTEYATMRDALNATGVPFFCEWRRVNSARALALPLRCSRRQPPPAPPSHCSLAVRLGGLVRARLPLAGQQLPHRRRRHELGGRAV